MLEQSNVSQVPLVVEYQCSVPEPLTILGGMTALGLGGVLKRKVKKNG